MNSIPLISNQKLRTSGVLNIKRICNLNESQKKSTNLLDNCGVNFVTGVKNPQAPGHKTQLFLHAESESFTISIPLSFQNLHMLCF